MKTAAILLLFAAVYCYGCKEKKEAPVYTTTSFDYYMGDSLLKLKNDSAFYFYNKVVNESENIALKAGAYNRMALLQYKTGDYYGSQETLVQSLKLLDEKKETDHQLILSNYNLLARTYLGLKRYEEAITYFDSAQKFNKTESFAFVLTNGKALAYQKEKKYDTAISLYKSVIGKSKEDSTSYSMILSNFARTKWLADSAYDAAPEMLEALKIRTAKGDISDLHTSYAHLADYYAGSHPDSSLFYATKMYETAIAPDESIEALQKLIISGLPQNVRKHFNTYLQLSDSLQNARNNAKNQFAIIRYNTEKNKADNLQLQKDNLKQRLVTGSVIIASFVVIMFGIVWYRRRKQRMENMVRENQLKTSKKVHDVVANGLYQILAELEHRDIDKQTLLDRIEKLYEQSRDLSYEQPSKTQATFSQLINELLASFATTTTRILITGNKEELWQCIPAPVKEELKLILLEIMVNMKKHSQACEVIIRFVPEEDHLKIHYQDNGVGIPGEIQYGNGLRNTVSRIENIAGTISFRKNNGLQIEISLPTSTI